MHTRVRWLTQGLGQPSTKVHMVNSHCLALQVNCRCHLWTSDIGGNILAVLSRWEKDGYGTTNGISPSPHVCPKTLIKNEAPKLGRILREVNIKESAHIRDLS